jgi:hypothetical protein
MASHVHPQGRAKDAVDQGNMNPRSASKSNCRNGKNHRRQEIAGPGKQVFRVHDEIQGRPEVGSAGQIGHSHHNNESADDFPRRFARVWHAALHNERGNQHQPEQCPAHQPLHGHTHLQGRVRRQNFVEMDCSGRFDHAGKHKSKGKSQRQAVMRSAELHQCIRRIREAKQAANNLEIGIENGVGGIRKLAQPCGGSHKGDHAGTCEIPAKTPTPPPN